VLHLPGQEYADLPAWPTLLTLFGYSMFLACSFSARARGLDSVWVWQARGVLSVALVLSLRSC
jgi:hypothetical protein